jgi:hypothetical protein
MSNEAFGPQLQGAHQAARLMAAGAAFDDDGTLIAIAKIEGLEDVSEREGEAILKILHAIAGPDHPSNGLKAIVARLDGLLRQLDATYEIPKWRRRKKQTTSRAVGQVYKTLQIDRLNTGRSYPREHREAFAEAQRERWRKKKSPGEATSQGILKETINATSTVINNGAVNCEVAK